MPRAAVRGWPRPAPAMPICARRRRRCSPPRIRAAGSSSRHGRLILHRDLKPANIVVDASGTPKLLDFGIAKLLDDADVSGLATDAGQRVMTPLYASPEQRAGDPLTTASDVYALGLLLEEVV